MGSIEYTESFLDSELSGCSSNIPHRGGIRAGGLDRADSFLSVKDTEEPFDTQENRVSAPHRCASDGSLCEHERKGMIPTMLKYSSEASFTQDWRAYHAKPYRPRMHHEGRFTSSFMRDSPVICCFHLSYWHQVFGPKVEHIWMQQPSDESANELQFKNQLVDPSLFKNDTQLHLCRQIFMGEICRLDKPVEESSTESKICILPDYNILIFSEMFFVEKQEHMTHYALSAYIFQQHRKRATAISPLIQRELHYTSRRIREIKRKGLSIATLGCSLLMSKLLFSVEKLFMSEIPEVVMFDTWLHHSFIREEHNKLFMARMITSFLQTHKHAVVLGSHEKQINQIISTLALFLSEGQRKRAGYCDQSKNTFVSNLHLQGLIIYGELGRYISHLTRGEEKSRHPPLSPSSQTSKRSQSSSRSETSSNTDQEVINEDLLIFSEHPVTLIDTRDKSVWRTKLFPDFRAIRDSYMESTKFDYTSFNTYRPKFQIQVETFLEEYPQGYKGFITEIPAIQERGDFLFEVDRVAPLVMELVEQITQSPEQLHQALISNFMRTLVNRTVFMINFANSVFLAGGYKGPLVLNDRDRGLMKADLKIHSDEDYNILLGLAELYCPGAYQMLRGNPHIIEKKFIRLFKKF